MMNNVLNFPSKHVDAEVLIEDLRNFVESSKNGEKVEIVAIVKHGGVFTTLYTPVSEISRHVGMLELFKMNLLNLMGYCQEK